MTDLASAHADVARSSGGGVGFLLAYALTLSIVTVLAFTQTVEVGALAFLFQGGVALPLAFYLERQLGYPAMATDNPLRALSIQLAMIQVVALPAVILVYALDPTYVPAAFAAVVGGHFLPYAWLHRIPAYVVLGVAASFFPLGLMVVGGAAAFPYVPLALAVLYLAMAAYLLTMQHPMAVTRGGVPSA